MAGASGGHRKIDKKRVTHHTLGHSYAAIRLQTVDAGEPVALYTVARELGHSGNDRRFQLAPRFNDNMGCTPGSYREAVS